MMHEIALDVVGHGRGPDSDSDCFFWLLLNTTRDLHTIQSNLPRTSSISIQYVMSSRPPQHGLEWTYELFDVIPSWTVQPDMAVAKAIAVRHLPVTTSSYEIRSFSAGAFNKLFLLHPLDDVSGALESFIMRISLPVDPYFKTASEVATLQFVK